MRKWQWNVCQRNGFVSIVRTPGWPEKSESNIVRRCIKRTRVAPRYQGGAAGICLADGGAAGGGVGQGMEGGPAWLVFGRQGVSEGLVEGDALLDGIQSRQAGAAGNRRSQGRATDRSRTQAAVDWGGLGAASQRRRAEGHDCPADASGNDNDLAVDCQTIKHEGCGFVGEPAARCGRKTRIFATESCKESSKRSVTL